MTESEAENTALDDAIADAARAMTFGAAPSSLRQSVRARLDADEIRRPFGGMLPVRVVFGGLATASLIAMVILLWRQPGVTVESPAHVRDVATESVVLPTRTASQEPASDKRDTVPPRTARRAPRSGPVAVAVEAKEAAPPLVVTAIAIEPLLSESGASSTGGDLMALSIDALRVVPLSIP